MENTTTNFNLEQFTSSLDSKKFFYQILRMKNSIYIWVGTEEGTQCSLAKTIIPRFPTSAIPVSMLLGPRQDMIESCAAQLEAKLKIPILLSLNIPEDTQVLRHVEKTVLNKLTQ